MESIESCVKKNDESTSITTTYEISINDRVMVELRFWYSCRSTMDIYQSGIMQRLLAITRMCDYPMAHYVLVSCLWNLSSLPIHDMMDLQEVFQGFNEIGYFRVLLVMPILLMKWLHLVTCVSKTLEVCVSAAMAPVSRFELIGDEYLYVAPRVSRARIKVWIVGVPSKNLWF